MAKKAAAQADQGRQLIAEIDRVLEILQALPTLKRYGNDEDAMKEAVNILERVREKL